MLGGLLCACHPKGSATPDSGAPDVELRNPRFTALSRTCNQTAGEWVVDAETDAWSGGLTSWWTVDGEVVERHVVSVLESEPDGSYDHIRGVFPIVTDWRNQSNNQNTQFRCTQPVATVFWLENTEGARVDCQVRGDPAALEGLVGPPPCDQTNL